MLHISSHSSKCFTKLRKISVFSNSNNEMSFLYSFVVNDKFVDFDLNRFSPLIHFVYKRLQYVCDK